MIVQDKEASIKLANEISAKLLSIITNEVKDCTLGADPAEQVYLGSHIIGILFAKVVLALEGYGKIYTIAGLDTNIISEWINIIAKENIKLNKE